MYNVMYIQDEYPFRLMAPAFQSRLGAVKLVQIESALYKPETKKADMVKISGIINENQIKARFLNNFKRSL